MREEWGSTEQEVGTLAPWGQVMRLATRWLGDSTFSRHLGTAGCCSGWRNWRGKDIDRQRTWRFHKKVRGEGKPRNRVQLRRGEG